MPQRLDRGDFRAINVFLGRGADEFSAQSLRVITDEALNVSAGDDSVAVSDATRT